MIINFIICGNQDDPEGNPVPKIKKTARQYWTPEAQRYQAWKNYIRDCFWDQVKLWASFSKNLIPFNDERAEMRLKIFWANEKHADAESIFGSIADALWRSDKHLDGGWKQHHPKDKKGRVEITITIK